MNIEEEVKKTQQQNCNHKCHDIGLNYWIEYCPICGCPNPKFEPVEDNEEEI